MKKSKISINNFIGIFKEVPLKSSKISLGILSLLMVIAIGCSGTTVDPPALVSSATTTKAAGTYGLTASIDIVLEFSQDVTLTGGTIDVTLDTGDIIQFAPFGPANTATANYLVGTGDNSSGLNVTAITLGTGATLDTTATLNLPSSSTELKSIIIDTTLPQINFTAASGSTTDESNSAQTITVTLDKSSLQTITVDVTDTGGTANSADDYNVEHDATNFNGSNKTITFAPGETSKTITLTPIQDLKDEGTGETVVLILSGPNNADLGTIKTFTQTITDDDAPPTIQFTSTSSSTTNESVTGKDVTIDLSAASGLSITVDLSVLGTSTAAGTDYGISSTGTITFNAGDTTKTITITPVQDTIDESNETVNLSIASPTNASLGTNTTHSLTIIDDDITISLASSGSTNAEDTGTVNVQLNSSKAAASNIQVNYTVSGTGGSGSDFDALSGNATILSGTSSINIPVNLINDIIDENNETVIITLNNTTSSYHTVTLSPTTVYTLTITDNDVSATNVFVAGTDDPAYYKENDTISISVTFSEAVTVNTTGGTPSIGLRTDSADKTATYTSGSGTSTLIFQYQVQSGTTAADLSTASVGTPHIITLNGGSIYRTADITDSANLALPSGAGSLATNENIVIDTTAPTVSSINSSAADGTYSTGATIPINVEFNEAVVVNTTGGTPYITLETGTTDRNATYASGSGTDTIIFNYVVEDGDTSADLNNTTGIILNSGTIADNANNSAGSGTIALGSLSTPKDIVIDTSIPTITNITSTGDNNPHYYKESDVINITVTFSEEVDVSGTPTLTLNSGGTASCSTISNSLTMSCSYTVGATENSTDLHVSGIAGGTIVEDGGGSAANTTLPSDGNPGSLSFNESLIVDTSSPTITQVTSDTADATYGFGTTIPIKVVFSEAVNLTGSPVLLLETGTIDRNAVYSSGNGTDTLIFNYNIQSGDFTTDLQYVDTSSLSGATYADLAGNSLSGTIPTLVSGNSLGENKALAIDGVVPQITNVTTTEADGTYGPSSADMPLNIEVTFNQNVSVDTGGGTPYINLNTTGTATYASGSGTSVLIFNYTPAIPHATSTLAYTNSSALKLNGGTIKKTALFQNNATVTLPSPGTAGSLSDNRTIAIDTTAPAVTLVTASNADGSYGTNDTITVQVAFNETVIVTGTPYITLVTNTTTSATTNAGYVSGTGTNILTFSYTVSNGHVSPDLNYEATTSLVLNGGTINDAGDNAATLTLPDPTTGSSLATNKDIVIDTIAAVITSVDASGSPDGTRGIGYTVDVQVHLSEAVNVDTTNGTPSITLETGSVDREALYTSGTGTSTLIFSYTVQENDTSADLNYVALDSLNLNLGSIKDAANNTANLTLPDPLSVDSLGGNQAIIVDGIKPTILNIITTETNGSYGPDSPTNPIDINITFSHAVTTTVANLALNTGVNATYASGSGTTVLTFSYTPVSPHTTSDLAYTGTTALSTSGTIQKSSGAPNDATLTLPAPGSNGSLSFNRDIAIDSTAPAATLVTSSTTDGTYGQGTVIPIDVTFNEIVVVASGTPSITLETGTTDREATYVSGTGTSTLTFNYTVQAGDDAADLNTNSTANAHTILLNGATITDSASNTSSTTLPSSGGNSLAENKAIVINTNVPAITDIQAVTASGSYMDGQTISFNVVFSAAVNITGFPRILMETGTNDVYATYQSGHGTNTLLFSFDVDQANNHTTSDLEYISTAIDLNSGSIKDVTDTNNANLNLPAGELSAENDIIIDTTKPTVTLVTSSTADGTYGEGTVIPISVSFDEVISAAVPASLVLSLDTGKSATYVSGDGTTTLNFSYTVQSGDTSTDLQYVSTGSLSGSAITDSAGNTWTAGLPALVSASSLGGDKDIVINTASNEIQFTTQTSGNIENITSTTIEVQSSISAASDITVNYTVTGTAAGSGADHNLASGSVIILTGSTTANITLPIVNDSINENNETVIITLDSASTGTIVTASGVNVHTYTITDDDDPPTVAFTLANSASLDETVTANNIAVQLSSVSEKTVTIDLAIDGTDTSDPSDYTLAGDITGSTITFNPGNTSKTLTITPTHDTDIEGSETVIMNLTSPSNVTIGAIGTHTFTIIDDDGSPTIAIQDTVYNESNCGTDATITVTMAGQDTSDVTIDYQTANGTADNSDYTTTSGTLTWTIGQTGPKTFTIPISCDTVAETDETVLITLSNVSANATVTDPSGILTILNDDTSLTIKSAETLDVDPVDGYIDHIKVTFQDSSLNPMNVDDTTFDGFIANSEGSITNKWFVSGYSNIRLHHGTSVSTATGGLITDTVDDNVIYLKVDQGGSVDTGVVPDVTASASTIAAIDGSGRLYNDTGNVLNTDVVETDKAKPYIWYAMATHVGGTNGSAGTTDTLEVRFTEATNATALTGVDLDTIFNLNNSHTFGDVSDITSATWSTTLFTNDTLTITFATDNVTAYDGDQIKATGTAIADLNLNTPENIANVLSPTTISGTFDSGAVGPTILSAEYLDTDSNGYLDHVKITFDKNVNDATFPGYVNDNSVGSTQTVWKVNGYNNVALDTTNTLDPNTNDNIIYLKFSEGSIYDTGSKPDLTAALGATGLQDATDNCYVNTNAANCLNQSISVVSTTHVVEQDKALPIITWATARVGERYLFLRFSENVWSAQDMPACGSGGQMVAADLSYSSNFGTNDGTNAFSVQSFETDNCGTSDAFVRVLTDFNFASGDISADQIAAANTQLYDAANNAMIDTNKTTIEQTIAPYVVTASSYYNADTSKYYLRIVFSEPMDFTSATTASNYTISEDIATGCADPADNPQSINAISSTVFDLQTGVQCGKGSASETVYRISVSGVLDYNEIEPIGSPNAATTIGTSLADLTEPRLIQALSLTSTSAQLTFSEPMTIGDVIGSAECLSTYDPTRICTADVDGTTGSQFKYTITPSLGAITSVQVTADPSVFILTHTDNQIGSFYTITAYADNTVTGIPQDKYGNNDIALAPENKITFKGSGAAVTKLEDGALFDDPFADETSFSYAFKYKDKIYLGPNDENSGAFRFEADGYNPVTVTFLASGSCANATTFGYNTGLTCGLDMGPNGEKGIVGFFSGTITLATIDYEILMLGPLKDGVNYVYFTQDIDTELNWTSSLLTVTGGNNTKSVQSLYAFGDSFYAGISSKHGQQSPLLNRFVLVDSGSGVLTVNSSINVSAKDITLIGKQGTSKNPVSDKNGVVGIDSMYYVSSTGTPTPVNTFYLANNGGLVAATYVIGIEPTVPTASPTDSEDFAAVKSQAQFAADGGGSTTLVLPDEVDGGLGKIRPGQKGMPFIVDYKGVLYIGRNIALSQTDDNETVQNGAEIWRCDSDCTVSANWKLALSSSQLSYTDDSNQGTDGSNNKAIGLMQVNGDYLYIGFENETHGVTIFRTKAGVTGIDDGAGILGASDGTAGNGDGHLDFVQQGIAGLGQSTSFRYIFSSASLKKLGKNYIYITVGDNNDAIKVVRQVDD